jgi:ATP phosphoribosyltransferase
LSGGGIIWDDGTVQAFRKRGSAVISSVLRGANTVGYIGTDRIEEEAAELAVENRGPVINDAGQPLRFALIARPGSPATNKLRSGEPVSIVSSYPRTALERLGRERIASVENVRGCIEAELVDRTDIDAAFELVQSGDSVRQNGLEIIEDDLRSVYLAMIRKSSYGIDGLMLANTGEKCEND